MIANNAPLGRHRDQDAAISAVVHAGAMSAQGHSVGVHMQIDAVRAFLTMRWAGGADMRSTIRTLLGQPCTI
jgi:hypothetical protein